MMCMRPPQQGHGLDVLRRNSWSASGSVAGTASSSRALATISSLAAAGEQAIVADAVEALRQDVEQEAADELGRGERHGGVAAWPFDPVVLDLEGDARLVGCDQAPVGDGDAMGVAG